MRTPAIHYAEHLINKNWPQAGLPDGRWVPARSEPFYSITQRWKAAWLVFTGKADALIWPGQ